MSQASPPTSLRERILRLAREIESLSGKDIPPAVFFPQFIDRLIQAINAQGAAVFLLSGGGLRLEHGFGLEELGLLSDPAVTQRNQRLLSETLSTGETKAYAADDAAVPTRNLYVVSALSCGTEPVGVLEVLLRPETTATAKNGLLQFVEQMAGYASRYLARQRDQASRRRPSGGRVAAAGKESSGKSIQIGGSGAGTQETQGGFSVAFWSELERFLLQLERGRNVKEVAATAASDGRLLLGVDRVSLIRKRGRKIQVEAISGQDKVNRRANLVRRMSVLGKKVMKGREPLIYTGNVDDLPPQLEGPLADFVAESNSRLVMIIPLTESNELIRPEFEDKEQERRRSKAEPRVMGALVVEEINDSRVPPMLREKIDLAADHVAASLQQAITLDRIFMRRTLLAIGRTGEWFHGRKLAKTLAVLGVIVAIALSLWLIPWPYKVVAEGQLMPVGQRNVFAPWNGEVVQLLVEGGDHVEKGELLAVLSNDAIRSQVVDIRNKLAQKRKMVETLTMRAGVARGQGRAEYDKLAAEREAAEAEVRGLEEQLAILEDRQDHLRVVAPISGQIATFQLEERLRHRPVRRGEVLMEIMNDEGRWHLELNVEDRRMGHINDAIGRREGDVGLPVEFVLATAPAKRYDGTLNYIESRTHAERELGNIVPVEVAIDQPEKLPSRRIGAEVRAKIDTGDRALGYVLFGDVIAFVRRHLWL